MSTDRWNFSLGISDESIRKGALAYSRKQLEEWEAKLAERGAFQSHNVRRMLEVMSDQELNADGDTLVWLSLYNHYKSWLRNANSRGDVMTDEDKRVAQLDRHPA